MSSNLYCGGLTFTFGNLFVMHVAILPLCFITVKTHKSVVVEKNMFSLTETDYVNSYLSAV